MKKIPMAPGKIPAGLRGLAQWMEAQRKAELVLGVLVKHGVITTAEVANFLEEATGTLLGDNFWSSVKAGAKAHSSNEKAKELSGQRQEILFAWLDKNISRYKNLDKVAQAAVLKNIVPWGFDQIRRNITEYRRRKNS